MRTFTKLLIAVWVCVFAFASCDKEGQFNPSKKIASIIYTSGSYSEQTNYTWDGKKLVRADYKEQNSVNGYSKSYTEHYTYDKKKRISIVTTDYGETWKYIYDGYQLKRIDVYDGVKLSNSFYFEHTGSKITRIIIPDGDKKTDKVSKRSPLKGLLPDNVLENIQKTSNKKGNSIINLTWKGDNISSVSCDEYYYTYTYDAKRNPLYGLNCPEAVGMTDQILTSKNNIVSSTYNDKSPSGKETVTIYYNYDYEERYPVECSSSDGDVTRYTYK